MYEKLNFGGGGSITHLTSIIVLKVKFTHSLLKRERKIKKNGKNKKEKSLKIEKIMKMRKIIER